VYDITLTVMFIQRPFGTWSMREKLTTCSNFEPCIINSELKLNEHKLQQSFVTTCEQEEVRKFIERNYDEIIRKPCEFLTTSPENKERLILRHKLYENIHNNPIITYMFWEEEHAGIRAYIYDYMCKRCIARNIQVPGKVTVLKKNTLYDKFGNPIMTSALVNWCVD
jgi:hypothetical protein